METPSHTLQRMMTLSDLLSACRYAVINAGKGEDIFV